MSAKTKIVVLHMKELIYTGIFAALGILFIILMITMFVPDKGKDQTNVPKDTAPDNQTDSTLPAGTSADLYIPGIYTTQLVLGGQALEVEVIVSRDAITGVRLVNPDPAVTTMYPLLAPAMASISEQIYETQDLSGITYPAESKYTSLVLLEAIRNTLQKASLK